MQTDLQRLKEYWNLMTTYYATDHKRMKLLDATDRGNLWKALQTKYPSYQILPDTNHVTYVKSNILASIYTVTKSANITPTSENDREIVMHINIALDKVWDLADVGFFQFQAGDRAALLNLGLTQVGWDETLTGGSGDSFYKGNVTLKNIDPMKFMRDAFSGSLETAGYCVTYDDYHKSVFQSNPNYAPKFKEYMDKFTAQDVLPKQDHERPAQGQKDYYTLKTWWVREGKQVHEIHTLNDEVVLYQKENIQPAEFPIVELYCNLPAGGLVGTSEPAKIFANSVACNLMDSIALTAEYKNQRPPKFISAQSGLNIQSFAKYGDDADKTFIVNGRADQAVSYHQFPSISPAAPMIKKDIGFAIENISGVDGRYTGRDTGSIITTGGTEEMLNRVTLIDTPKIINYERYTKRLTKLILSNLVTHAPKRAYLVKKPMDVNWTKVEIDFPKLDNNTLFNYTIDISSELPKNKQRIAATANMLMEKQMQYQEQGSSVQLITEEEWLMMQDLPNKEYMLERMGIQRMDDAVQETSQVLFEYAELVKNGMPPDEAILATAQSLKNKRQGMMPEEGPVPAITGEPMMQPQDPMMMGQPPMGGMGGGMPPML